MPPTQLCTFFLDGLYFGVDVTRVREVLRQQELTQVPLAPVFIRGLINRRGQIVTVLDLRQRLGFPARAAGAPSLHLVVHGSEGDVSLLVDDIGEVLEVDPALFELPPETRAELGAELILGVYKLPDKLLSLLDLDCATRCQASDAPAHTVAGLLPRTVARTVSPQEVTS